MNHAQIPPNHASVQPHESPALGPGDLEAWRPSGGLEAGNQNPGGLYAWGLHAGGWLHGGHLA